MLINISKTSAQTRLLAGCNQVIKPAEDLKKGTYLLENKAAAIVKRNNLSFLGH
jgi:hypothetical protein